MPRSAPRRPSKGGQRAAIYVRISNDPTGRAAGVERQRADCQALADRLGLTVSRVYQDNDVSAYSRRRRPEYEALLADIESGLVQTVIAWHTDRLHRRVADLERFVALAEARHIDVRTVTAGDLDLSSASGRMVARMLGAVAQHEVDHARERMKRAKLQAAAEGRHRGGPRPFGWGTDAMVLAEDEARWIRQGCRDVLAGRTLHAIAREWNEAGVLTSTGKSWSYHSVRTVLCRPRNAGLVSTGRPDRAGLEIVGAAKWQAIVSEDVWRRVHIVLTNPARRQQRGNALRWLGSGLYKCGVDGCAGVMRVAPMGRSKPGSQTPRRYLYRCVDRAHLTMSTDEADAVVLALVRRRLSRVNLTKMAKGDENGQTAAMHAERDALVARLARFEEDYAQGLVDGRQLASTTTKVYRALSRLDGQLERSVRRSPLAFLVGSPGHIVDSFDAAPLDVQRAVLDALVEVRVLPSGRGRERPLGADRLRFVWR